MTAGLEHSVHARLVRHAKELGINPNTVLVRYASERFLYRLSRSPHSERFVLKGAALLLVWLGATTRPTRDVDLLGRDRLDAESLLDSSVPDLLVVIDAVATFAGPVLLAVAWGDNFTQTWPPGGPWTKG